MSRPRVQAGCLQIISLLKDGVSDGEFLLCTKLQQQALVVVAFANAVLPKHSLPCF